MARLLIAIVLAVVSGSAFPAVILVVGDSISSAYGMPPDHGWVALMQQRFDAQRRAYTLVNTSISGDTTAGGRARIERALAEHRPEVVIIQLGANDGLRGLPLGTMKANLGAMIEKSKAAGAKVLLLGMRIPPNYGKRYTQSFYDVFAEIKDEYQVALIPFFLDPVAAQPEFLQADALHPNGRAQPYLMELVWDALQGMLPELR